MTMLLPKLSAGKGFFVEVFMEYKAQLMDEQAVHRALTRLSHEILERNKGADNLIIVGIKRRGEPIARDIANNIMRFENIPVPCCSLDIKYYRDDLTHISELPVTKSTSLPFDVNGKDVILVDDVIYTGRTARAAIEAIFSCGRPQSIQLAVIIDRGHRELPIRPDYVGKNTPTSKSEVIHVHVPDYDGDSGVYLMENN